MAETREQILRAADELFGEAGFDGAGTRQIAEQSGVNKALIHYHFKSKEALFNAVLERYYDQLDATLRTELLSATGSPPERLMRLIDAYFDFLASHRGFCRMVHREVAGGRQAEFITARMAPLFELGTKLLREAYPKTQVGDFEASQLLISFYGMVVATFTYAPILQGLLGEDPGSQNSITARKRHLGAMAALVLEQITGTPKAPRDGESS